MRIEQVEDDVPLYKPGHTLGTATDVIAAPVLQRPPLAWLLGLLASLFLLTLFFFGLTWLLARGVGIWGVNIPVAWGFAIVNFVWWIGIGHAGTLISAILLLLHQQWRTSINRVTEAMTLFAVTCAGLFPLMHLGRPWLFYWIAPYPSTFGAWPNYRSALVWDMFAVLTYFTISLLFWYLGLVPDLATLRDKAQGVRQKIYGVLALGWRGSARHWKRHESAYKLLAGLATPLVVSVHTIVSFDFAITQLPGWHSTMFPPYFVAGAIYSGFAMTLTILIPLRRLFRLQDFITLRHLDYCAQLMLATGWIVIYGYFLEGFYSWYSADEFERYMMENRIVGPYGFVFWLVMFCNCLAVQVFWSRRARRNVWVLFALGVIVNLGMWFERVMIVITSLHRDFLPSSWDMYWPTVWDWLAFFGTVGVFCTLMFLFVRYFPSISMSEMRAELPTRAEKAREGA